MQTDKELFRSMIMDFLIVVHKCFHETTYAQDKALYANDIAMAVGWLVKLHQCEAPKDVATAIVDSSTTKYFTDYWKSGHWGGLEAEALKHLQDTIRSRAWN